MITVAACNIYPIKSLGGISLTETFISARGPRHDRLFMLVDNAGRFITQRQETRLATIKTKIENDVIRLTEPGGKLLEIAPKDLTDNALKASIWNDVCEGRVASTHVNAWFFRFLTKAGAPGRIK